MPLTGVSRCRSLLQGLGQAAREADAMSEEAALQSAVELAGEIYTRAPRLTGAMAGSIEIRKHGPESRHGAAVEIVVKARYSPFVERGTKYMAAQPFVAPAVEEMRPRIGDLWTRKAAAWLRRRIGGA